MKRFIILILFIVLACGIFADDITTAGVFFSGMSDEYAKIVDYSANIKITQGNNTSIGVVKFKNPDKLRMDFSVPANQAIVFTGDLLTIYLPTTRVTLSQSIEGTSAGAAGLASGKGLSLMKRSYTIAYETGSSPVPLEEGSEELVVALILHRRNANETFRQIRLLVSPETKLIRRIEAWPISGSKITFDFTQYKINGGIADTVFVYNAPPSEIINNFLYLESKQ